MNEYALVEDGEVVAGPGPLPTSWGNVSNLDLLDDEAALRKLGWYPVERKDADWDPDHAGPNPDLRVVKSRKVVVATYYASPPPPEPVEVADEATFTIEETVAKLARDRSEGRISEEDYERAMRLYEPDPRLERLRDLRAIEERSEAEQAELAALVVDLAAERLLA